MIKVPATPEGLPAIEHLIGEGISVNITLLFSQDVYRQVVEAYLTGLEKYVGKGGDPSHVASVASFFVSRIDTMVDKQLDEKIAQANDPGEKERLAALKGKIAIANAKLAYQDYKRLFAGDRWEKLAGEGRQAAAAAVGLHRHQEQGLQRRALCRGADRPRHRQHRAAGDARCLPRPRQGARQPRGERRRRAACARRVAEVRHLARCDHRPSSSKDGVKQFADAADKLYGAVAHKRAAVLGGSIDRQTLALGAGIEKAVEQEHRGMARLGEGSPALAARTSRSGPATTRTNGSAG